MLIMQLFNFCEKYKKFRALRLLLNVLCNNKIATV